MPIVECQPLIDKDVRLKSESVSRLQSFPIICRWVAVD